MDPSSVTITRRGLRPADVLALGAAAAGSAVRGARATSLATWMLHDGSLTRPSRAPTARAGHADAEGIGRASRARSAVSAAFDIGGWWIREITLAAGGTRRLRARTLVPRFAIDLQRRLRGLGSTPLGRVLFDRRSTATET